MNSNKYIVDRFDDFFVVLLEKGNKANKLVILKDKFTINAKEGDLLEVHIKKDKLGYEFKALKEEIGGSKKRLLDLIEGMKRDKQ